MPRNWLESLEPEARSKAEGLIEQLRGLGAPQPEAWARREGREGLPQVSRLLLLKHLWAEAIEAWRDSTLWIENLAEDAREGTPGPFADSGAALLRLLDAGADPADVAALARFVAYESVFSVIHALDEGYAPEHEGQLPGWAVVERDPLGHVTGRRLDRLHVDLPALDPAEVGRADRDGGGPSETG